MRRKNRHWLAPSLLLFVCLLSSEAWAQEYRFARSIGRPPAIGEPYGLAVDRSGNVYVADRTNGRVIRVTAARRMELNAVRALQPMNRPAAVAVDRQGNLVVAEETQPVIHRFSSRGVEMKSISALGVRSTAQSSGFGGGVNLAGITVDARGNIYVSDRGSNEIRKYGPDGALVTSFGGAGDKPGSLYGPRGLSTDAQGNVYVADEFNNRIQKFSPQGKLLSTSTPEALGEILSKGLGPMDVAVDSKGNMWVAAHTNFAVYKLDPNYNIIVKLDTFGRNDGELAGPVSLAVDAGDNVYVLDRSRRIQKFTPQGRFVSKFSFPDAKPGEFSAPIGVKTDSEGNLYVADDANFRIQKFDRNGNPVTSWGRFGHGDGEFNGVESLAVDRYGNLYAVDSFNHRVQKFDRNGKFITKWGSFGKGDGEFARTKVVEVDVRRDIVYVNDWHNARVQKFDLNGKYLGQFGNTGPRETQVLGPTGLAVDDAGNIYVSSWFNNRVQKFGPDGTFIKSIGGEGTGDGQFKGPARLSVDGSGNLVVVDWGNSRVQILNTDGRFITKFGSLGRAEGQFYQPVGVTVDKSGNLFVSDAANSRVQVFSRGATARAPVGEKVSTLTPRIFVDVTIYDVLPGKAHDFESALLSAVAGIRGGEAFVNERVLRNVDEQALQYATYTKAATRVAAESFHDRILERVRALCRREPESHLAELTEAYYPEGITDHPTGLEYGGGMTGQIAHLGLFIPIPQYRQQYDGVLRETKELTRAKKPTGYVGEDVMVEASVVPPERQTPYTPRATEPSKMSINYGEYRTMENAEDSYISRQSSNDPKVVTMERTFFSALQVPTRFYIFQVIGNYSRAAATASNYQQQPHAN